MVVVIVVVMVVLEPVGIGVLPPPTSHRYTKDAASPHTSCC